MPTADRWKDFRARALSAAILAPCVLLCIWWGGYLLAALVLCATFILIKEWVAMCGSSPRRPLGVGATLCVLSGTLAAALGRADIGLAILAFGAGLVAVLSVGTSRALMFASGIPYVGVGTIALLWIRDDPAAGYRNVMFLLLLVWASDIGAYAAGRLIGGPKLAPRISPGKTWSGAVGGLAAAIGAGLLVAWVSGGSPHPGRVGVIAAAIGAIAQAGDLLESVIKRRFGVKDSGTLIPGHGGLLDRVDALLTATPVAALLAFAAGRGVVLWQ